MIPQIQWTKEFFFALSVLILLWPQFSPAQSACNPQKEYFQPLSRYNSHPESEYYFERCYSLDRDTCKRDLEQLFQGYSAKKLCEQGAAYARCVRDLVKKWRVRKRTVNKVCANANKPGGLEPFACFVFYRVYRDLPEGTSLRRCEIN